MARAKVRHRRVSWKWYAVRSLYRLVALGEPKKRDANFSPGATLVEERLVLIQARNAEEAFSIAKKEGKAYTKSIQCTNGYGQKVQARMLKALDAYELDSLPKSGEEFFSSMEEIDSSVPDECICERPIGLVESATESDPWRRFKFIDVKIARLLLEQVQNRPPSSCPGNEHDR